MGRSTQREKIMMSIYTDLRAEYLNEWQIWYRMCKRCREDMEYYVETEVCDRWQGPQGFVNWFDDMGPRPSPDSVMDRINKFGDYEPGNVVWTTKKFSNNNHKQHQDSSKLPYWRKVAESNGISKYTFYSRVRDYGWNVIDAATFPPSQKKYKKRLV